MLPALYAGTAASGSTYCAASDARAPSPVPLASSPGGVTVASGSVVASADGAPSALASSAAAASAPPSGSAAMPPIARMHAANTLRLEARGCMAEMSIGAASDDDPGLRVVISWAGGREAYQLRARAAGRLTEAPSR